MATDKIPAEGSKDDKKKMHVPQFRSFVDKSDYAFIEPVFENNYIAEGPFAQTFPR